MIKTIDLSRNFGKKEAVKKINIKVKKKEIFGLIGPNGAGKTTFIRLLTGILKPSSGNAYVGGYDIINQIWEIREIVGLLPEGTPIFPRLKAYETLKFFMEFYGKRDNGDVERLLKEMELWESSNEIVDTFSAGMKKKLLFALSLIHDPQILFLDEPTSGLDPRAAVKVRDLIIDQKNKGKTILLTAHDMNLIDKICDRVALINRGEVVVQGTIEELKEIVKEKTGKGEMEDVFLYYT